MVEVKESLKGDLMYRNANLVTIKVCEDLYKMGVCISVNDGEYCSVTSE